MNYNLYVILKYEPLLIPIISSGSKTTTDNGYQQLAVLEPLLIILNYQQQHIYNDLETVTDNSFEPLDELLFSSDCTRSISMIGALTIVTRKNVQ
jgi:hypothetical protein